MSLQYIYRVIPLLTLLSPPRLHGQERSWVLFITKNLIFSQRGNDFAHVTLLSGMLLELRIWSSEANFCHWSNAFWLGAICPPLFPQRGLDFESAMVDLNFSDLHRVAGAMIPMVRRTGDFIATKSILKSNCILTIFVCSTLSAT